MSDKMKRFVLALSGLMSWALILFAWLYLEKVLYLAPCPLCMMQRVAFFLIGLMFIIEAICWPQRPMTRFITMLLKYAAIFFGIGLAARHLWIQSLPADKVPACGLDFWGTLHTNGFLAGIAKSMQGTGDCAVPDKFLWFTIPTWSMAAFIGFLLIAVVFGRASVRDRFR